MRINPKSATVSSIMVLIKNLWLVPVMMLSCIIIYLTYFDNNQLYKTSDNNRVEVDVSALKRYATSEIKNAFHNTVQIISSKTDYPPYKVLPYTQKLRILVTGGAGFVGSHLVDRLLREGHYVIVIDNYFTGKQSNLDHWRGHNNLELIVHDIIKPIQLEVDQIYHLACPASPVHYREDPVKTILTNTRGTMNMLGLAKRKQARMLLASSSDIYGDPTVHPQPESYVGNVNPIGLRACYDEGKRVAETMMYSFFSQSNVEIRVARIFNTFGPRMQLDDGRVVSNFMIQALQNKDILVEGDGKQTRSFQYVDDLVDGLVKLMNGNYSNPVNLGNPEECTIA
eukprot:gene15581-21043_t